jgi:beta-N-acetylhexosaminidase
MFPGLKRIKSAAGAPFFMSLSGESILKSELKMLKEMAPSGLIYFKRNVESCESLQSLIDATHEVESILFHAIDEEGGRVRRLPDGPWSLPSMKELVEAGINETARQTDILGQKLREIGINMNMAPNVDLRSGEDKSIVGDRSFGEDPETVAQFAEIYINMMKKNGVAPVIKHFPGHGTTTIDSHKSLPVIDKPFNDLDREDMAPYRKLAQVAGYVMVAHLLHHSIDDLPATLSAKWNEILRKNIGFSGISMTDDMEMLALEKFSPAQKMEMFFNSGCDMLLVCSGKEDVLMSFFEASVDFIENNQSLMKKMEFLKTRLEDSLKGISH